MQVPLPPAPPTKSKSLLSSPPTPSPRPSPQQSGCGSALLFILFIVVVAYVVLYIIPSTFIAQPRYSIIVSSGEINKVDNNTNMKSDNRTHVESNVSDSTYEIHFSDNSCKTFPIVRYSENRIVKWLVDMEVTKITIQSGRMTIYFKIIRTASTQQMWWAMNKEEEMATYIKTQDSIFSLLEAGGFFTRDTVLQPRQEHTGWLAFAVPNNNIFELAHPNIKSRFIINLQEKYCQTT